MGTSRKSSCTPLGGSADTAPRHVDLIAPLDDPRFAQSEVHHALEALDRQGIYAYREHRAPERILAWIDAEFGGTWSSDAAAGGIWIAQDADGPLGFCAFDARGLRYRWLRVWEARPSVGLCGPFGVGGRGRGRGVGTVLLHAALFSLRERGYARALFHVADASECPAYLARHANARLAPDPPASVSPRRRTTILASGNGTNFQAVVDGAASGDLPVRVTSLVFNKRGARVERRAVRAGVATRLVAWDRALEDRAAYDARVLAAVAASDPELVLLLGWMHVLAPSFIARFPELLNLHPAFLPLDPARDDVMLPDGTQMAAFRGPRAVDDALAAGSAWIGASVHRVGVAVDRGVVLARAPLPLVAGEPRERLDERLHALERRVVGAALLRWGDEC